MVPALPEIDESATVILSNSRAIATAPADYFYLKYKDPKTRALQLNNNETWKAKLRGVRLSKAFWFLFSFP